MKRILLALLLIFPTNAFASSSIAKLDVDSVWNFKRAKCYVQYNMIYNEHRIGPKIINNAIESKQNLYRLNNNYYSSPEFLYYYKKPIGSSELLVKKGVLTPAGEYYLRGFTKERAKYDCLEYPITLETRSFDGIVENKISGQIHIHNDLTIHDKKHQITSLDAHIHSATSNDIYYVDLCVAPRYNKADGDCTNKLSNNENEDVIKALRAAESFIVKREIVTHRVPVREVLHESHAYISGWVGDHSFSSNLDGTLYGDIVGYDKVQTENTHAINIIDSYLHNRVVCSFSTYGLSEQYFIGRDGNWYQQAHYDDNHRKITDSETIEYLGAYKELLGINASYQ